MLFRLTHRIIEVGRNIHMNEGRLICPLCTVGKNHTIGG